MKGKTTLVPKKNGYVTGVLCPCYNYESKKQISCMAECEGKRIHQTFYVAGGKKRYMKKFCKGEFAACPIYRIICDGEQKTR